MGYDYSTKISNQVRPLSFKAYRIGGMFGAVILSGLLVGACDSDLHGLGADLTASNNVEVIKSAAAQFQHQRLDHSVVMNQPSTGHDSDLPGMSIAAYRE